MTEQQILAYLKQKFAEMPFVGSEIQWAVAAYNYLDEKTRPQQVVAEDVAEQKGLTKASK